VDSDPAGDDGDGNDGGDGQVDIGGDAPESDEVDISGFELDISAASVHSPHGDENHPRYGRNTGPSLAQQHQKMGRLLSSSVHGGTAHHIASYGADDPRSSAVRELLAARANPHALDNERMTPLHHAAAFNRRRACALLMARKSHVNAGSVDGETPLHLACRAATGLSPGISYQPTDRRAVGAHAALFLLQEAGADPNVADLSGRTPLMIAAETGQAILLEALVRAGASVGARDAMGLSACERARGVVGNAAIVASMEAAIETAETNLAEALRALDPGTATGLVHKGNARAVVDGLPVLHHAVMTKSVLFVDHVLACGADPGAVAEESRETAVHLCARIDAPDDIATLLLLAGAPLRARDGEGRSLLHVAAAHDRQRLCVELIDNGLEVGLNNVDGEGRTVLAAAAGAGAERTLATLLTRADDSTIGAAALREARDTAGQTASELAEAGGHTGCMSLLSTATAVPITANLPLGRSAEGDALEDTHSELTATAGTWLLARMFLLCRAGDAIALAPLVSTGNVNTRDPASGDTLLHAAVRARSRECVVLLLGRGASPTALDASARSALDISGDTAAEGGDAGLRALLLVAYLRGGGGGGGGGSAKKRRNPALVGHGMAGLGSPLRR
jgi:ankyrin repeat protein